MPDHSHREPPNELIVSGFSSVRAALTGESRTCDAIFVDRAKTDRRTAWLIAEAGRRLVPVERVDRGVIDMRASGGTHGGLIAVVGPRKYSTVQEIAQEEVQNTSPRMIVMLDGIEDPYNLGFAIRTLYAAGIDGVVLRGRSWGEAESTILRSSAGAYDLMPIAGVESAEEGARICRRAGMIVAATAHGRGSRSLYDTDLARPLFLLIGGERRGITRSFVESADLILHIPYGREFDGSLGAASAAAVIGFEAMRQRGPLRSE